MIFPEPVAIVALTIEVVTDGALDRLLTAGASWRWSGHDWEATGRGRDSYDGRIWELQLVARAAH